jgi:chorismate--pyruvate lyase
MSRNASRWRRLPRPGLPRHLATWLGDKGSLTARLLARCQHLDLRVLRQGNSAAFADERHLLDLAAGRPAWRRDVVLIADGSPVVFAHSVLAPAQLRGPWRMAAGIGKRPLGAALFADPLIVRETLQVCRVDATHPLHRAATRALGQPLPALWARRSRFLRQGAPLLVTEVFLPGIAAL